MHLISCQNWQILMFFITCLLLNKLFHLKLYAKENNPSKGLQIAWRKLARIFSDIKITEGCLPERQHLERVNLNKCYFVVLDSHIIKKSLNFVACPNSLLYVQIHRKSSCTADTNCDIHI